MATSGSINYTQNASQIIRKAMILLGVVGIDEDIQSGDQALAISVFNDMLHGLELQNGVHLWRLDRGILLLNSDTIQYTFHNNVGTGGSVGAGIKESGFVTTTVSTDEATSSTVIGVTSSTGMTASDKISIVLDDGTRHDTTIATVDSATQVTISSGLASAASSGNVVYTYTPLTDEIFYPEELRNVRIIDSTGIEQPMLALSRSDYMNSISDKDLVGIPYTYYFDRQISNPVVYIYPAPEDLDYYIKYDYVRHIEDVDSVTDNIYFPNHWLEALTYGLAVRLGPYMQRIDVSNQLAGFAGSLLLAAKENDTENVSINFVPDIDYD